MSNQQSFTVSVHGRAFGVKVQWKWPTGSKEGDVMHIQALRKSGLTPVILVRFPKEHGVIGALLAGESVQVRARVTSDAGEFPDWQANDWHDAATSSGFDELVSIGRKVGEQFASSLCLTAGDDIEQQTLRDVLADMLPRTPELQMRAVAVTAAKAIRAAFDELRKPDASTS